MPQPQTTSAAEACAELQAWLDAQARRPKRDWPGLLGKIRDHLATLCRLDLIANDPEAQEIIQEMTRERGMEALNANVDRLWARVQRLLAQRESNAYLGAVPPPPSSLRSPLARSSRKGMGEGLELGSRTFLRL